MEIAAWILVLLVVLLTTGAALALLVWAAIKDGQEDRARQRRLGIRRRTRLGR